MSDITVYIHYHDSISAPKVKKFETECAEILKKHHPSRLYFLFSSDGGDIFSGIALFNYLRALSSKVKITMHSTGVVDSIAVPIFLAADERFAFPHSKFLFHEARWNISNALLKEVLAHIEGFRISENQIAGIISERTGMPLPDVKQMIEKNEHKDSTSAKAAGIVQEVKEVSIDPKAHFLTFNFD